MSANCEGRPNLRDEARRNIHRVGFVSADGHGPLTTEQLFRVGPDQLSYVWSPGGEARWRDLEKLIDQLAINHQIANRTGLEDAIDTAVLIYDHGPRNIDVKQLKLLPKIMEIFTEENESTIAGIVTDRYRQLVSGEPWNYEAALAVRRRIWKIRAVFSDPEIRGFFSDLSRALNRPRTRSAHAQLHGLVASLTRYWEGLGRKATCTFTKKDQKAKRQLAASEFAKFLESIISFIDSDAVPKLPSVTRHRLRN